MDIQPLLQGGIAELGLSVDQRAEAQLLDYVALLTKWNRVYNLTSVRKPRDMVLRHILDSLAVLPHVQGPNVLDIGTGAGLPGLVLAIVRPDWKLVLLDSSAKKLRFVRQCVGELDLANVQVVHARVEDFRHDPPFESVISRAFSTLENLYQAGATLCGPGGRLLAMKGVYPLAEVDALGEHKSAVRQVHALKVPGLDAERHVVVMACEDSDVRSQMSGVRL